MSEMIERVARAIWASEYTSPWPDGDGYPDDEYRLVARKQARAAIEAMREPTDAMKAVDGIHWGYGCHVCGGLTEGWQAMIDAALSEGEVG